MSENNSHVEKLLKSSIEQYYQLQKQTAALAKMIDKQDYSRVGEYAVQLKEMQAEASRKDEQLLPLLEEDDTVWKENELFMKRLEYIQSIVALNKLLLPKMESAMAVTFAEIETLSEGRNAIAGYASQETKNRSFLGVVG